MRSKEVDEAIKSFKEDMEIKRDETCWYHEKTSTGDCFTCPNRCGTTFIRNTKILNYISELEEKSKKCEYYEEVANELYKNSINKDKIRDKIKEEQELQKGFGKNEQWLLSCSNTIVEILESLLGE